MIWTRVTNKNPCPICNKTDWCQFGDRAMKCMRVPSDRPSNDGGFYHFYDTTKPDFLPRWKPPTSSQQSPTIDAAALMKEWQAKTLPSDLVLLAGQLGVTARSLVSLGVAWVEEYKGQKIRAFAFPMRDGDGNITGVRLRNKQGFKWAITGSREGIFVPNLSQELLQERIAFTPEGPTDTAAGLSLGLLTIGRPTCRTGNEIIKKTLQRIGVHKLVIVCDNDEMKQIANREGRPGLEGAKKMEAEIGIPCVIWIPPSPIKDLREFVRTGGSRKLIEQQVSNKVWTRK